MRIENPNHKPAAPAGRLNAAQRNQAKAAVLAAVKAWPADDAEISVHRLTIAVRAGLAGKVDPALFDGDDVAALLAELGYTVEG